MLTCKCGGYIGKGVLTGSRERWWCSACGRYEIMYRPKKGKEEEEVILSREESYESSSCL